MLLLDGNKQQEEGCHRCGCTALHSSASGAVVVTVGSCCMVEEGTAGPHLESDVLIGELLALLTQGANVGAGE